MEIKRIYNDPVDENDIANKRYVDKNVKAVVDKTIADTLDNSLGNIIVDSIKNKNIFPGATIGDVGNWSTGLTPTLTNSTTRATYSGVFIDISDYDVITASVNEGFEFGLAFCDANKKVLSNTNYASEYTKNITSEKYVCVKIRKTDNSIMTGADLANLKFQLEKGNVVTEFTPYKKYGYNSQESMGSIVVDDIKCKNLFNINNDYSKWVYNATFAKENNSYILKSNGAWAKVEVYNIPVTPGVTYTVSAKIQNSASVRSTLYVRDGNSASIGYQGTTSTSSTLSVTFTPTATTITLLFSSNDTSSTADNTVVFSEIQLEKGTVVSEYTPYKSFGYTSGSNENGHWIKYDDGTLIQRGTAVYPSGVDSYKLTFPMAFKDTDYQVSTETAYQYYRVLDFVRSNKVTNYIMFFASALKTSSSPYTWIFELEHEQEFDWIAIGRWK